MTPQFNFKKHFTKQKITQNIGLKITSLIVAMFLWYVVVNVTDPIIPGTYKNVPVKILNENVITDNGKTLEVVDDTDIIPSVTIKASRSIIQELGNSVDSIVATADMKNLSADGYSVPIDITTTKYSDKIESVRASVGTMHVRIENRKTIQLPLLATTSGEIESGYILGNITPNTNQVRVSGPESVIERIKSASVDVQVTGFTSNISTQSDIVLLDENGEEISKSNLTMNVESVRVDAEILATKRVPVYYSTSGIPAEGYAETGEVEINPETVVIAGAKSAIENVNFISIPSSELNLTAQTSNLYVVLNLNDYLPDGTRIADSSLSANVSVKVYVESLIESEIPIDFKDVSIVNVPEGFSAHLKDDTQSVYLMLKGLAQNLERIDSNQLGYRVDFEDYSLLNGTNEFEEGTYTCYLVLDLPQGVEAMDVVPVEVVLEKAE